MITFLRRHRPRNTVLAVVYWIVLGLVAVTLVFTLFYLLDVDRLVPGGGMF